jgi:hydrogenase maturation protease
MRTLVIGYGNRLRSDDGLGPAVADAVAAWHLPGVRALAVHQLVPELIEEMKDVERVLFVDASLEVLEGAFQLGRIDAKKSCRALGHHEHPANLLALARTLTEHSPEDWQLAISPHSLDYGNELTEIAKTRMQAALTWLRGWLTAST